MSNNLENRKPPCRFHQSGGCRFGASCKFLHIGPPGAAGAGRGRGRGAPPAPHTSHTAASNASSESSSTSRPYNACKTFWETGECPWGFECRRKHIPSSTTPDATNTTEPDQSTPVDPNSSTGQPHINAIVSPAEVHNFLNTCLHPSFQFSRPAVMQRFVDAVVSASSTSAKWVSAS